MTAHTAPTTPPQRSHGRLIGKLLADRPPQVRHLPRVAQPASVVVPAASVANDSHPATFVTAPQANDAHFDNEDLA